MRSRLGIACATLAVAAATFVARAQERERPERPVRDADIRELAAQTIAVPAEFAADALIRLSGSSRITDASWRRELLDEAYLRAYGAQEQYKRSSTLGIPPDSRQGAQILAYTAPLTRVTLQVRAAQLMALLDRSRALEMFEWIDLNLAPSVCEDPLVPAVDDYYSALGQLARTAFGNNRGEALRFLQLYLWRAHLPSEMPSVARAVQRFRANPYEASYLEGVFGNILETASLDPRGFSASDLDTVTRVADLQKADRDIGVVNWYLMEGLRHYLIAQLKGPRCRDSESESMTPAAFEAALGRVGAIRGGVRFVDPIPVSLQPSKMLGSIRVDMYWQTAEAQRLHEDAIQLRGRGVNPLPLKVRQTREWLEQAEKLIVAIDQWTGRREASERDYFYQKLFLLTGLFELTPSSRVRAQALKAFVEFMRHSDYERDWRLLWFAYMNRLLDMARGPDRREILTALEDSHHPVLSLYARMERVVPAGGTR